MRSGILMQGKEFRGEIIVPLPMEPVPRANMVAAVSHAWSLLMSQLEGVVEAERRRVEDAERLSHARAVRASRPKRGRPPKREQVNGGAEPEPEAVVANV